MGIFYTFLGVNNLYGSDEEIMKVEFENTSILIYVEESVYYLITNAHDPYSLSIERITE